FATSLQLPLWRSIRPPRRSTLFPYTTLFRSMRRARSIRAAGPDAGGRAGGRGAGRRFTAPGSLFGGIGLGPAAVLGPVGQQALADRKSTRLNSSHVKISYAVFCLKKKRRTQH